MSTALEPITEQVEEIAFGFKRLSPEEEERRRLEAEFQRVRKERVEMEERIAAANIPKRQAGTVAERRPGWAETFDKLVKRSGSGFLMALRGIRGNGKTQLAVELIRHNAGQRRSSRFCTAMEFFMEIKAGYRKDERSEKSILDEFCKPFLLVIDEIGQRSESEWENRLIYEMINRRYNDMKDTLLISNQEEAQMVTALGPSIVSRMNETGGVIPCEWESFRQ